MRINSILTEDVLVRQRILEDQTYKQFYKLGIAITEAAMTQQQIKQVFQAVADGAAGGANVKQAGDAPVSNRTIIGKGADVGAKVANAFNGLKKAISQSGAVSGLDVMFDKAQTGILKAAGGNRGKVGQALQWYRELSKVPGMQMAVKTIILGLAGLSGAGLGGAALVAGIATIDKLLQGEKLSSSIWSGIKSGAVAGAAGAIGNAAHGQQPADMGTATGADMDAMTDPGQAPDASGQFELPNADAAANSQADLQAAQDWLNADEAGRAQIEQTTGMPAAQLQDIAVGNNLQPGGTVPADATAAPADSLDAGEEVVGGAEGDLGSYTIAKGDTLGAIAQANGVSVEDLKGLNPHIDFSKPLQPGMNLTLPPAGDNAGSVWQGYAGNTYGDKAAMSQGQADTLSGRADNIANMQQQAAPTAEPAAEPAPAEEQPVYTPRIPPNVDINSFSNYVPTGNPYVDHLNKLKAQGINVRESMIDKYATTRMWALNEALGKPSKSVQLTNLGRKAIFTAVCEATALSNLKKFNKKAAKAVGKVTDPLSKAAAAGWDSATNNITYDKLDMNWRRGTNLGNSKSVDSGEVIKFLMDQGLQEPLIKAAFEHLGIPYEANRAGTMQAKGGFWQSLLKGAGADKAAQAVSDYSDTDTGGMRAPNDAAAEPEAEPAVAPTAAAAPAKAAAKKAAAPAAAKSEPIKIGGQTLDPNNPADAKIIAQVQKQQSAPATAPAAQPSGSTAKPASSTIPNVNYGLRNLPQQAAPAAKAPTPNFSRGQQTVAPSKVTYNMPTKAPAKAPAKTAAPVAESIDLAEVLWRKMKSKK
jgi:LysM repeat protein